MLATSKVTATASAIDVGDVLLSPRHMVPVLSLAKALIQKKVILICAVGSLFVTLFLAWEPEQTIIE